MENSFREFIYFNKKKILVLMVIVIISICCCFYYFFNDRNKEIEKDNKLILGKKEEDINLEDNQEAIDEKVMIIPTCFFDVKGEVKKTGVYEIDCSKHVIDAINMAGGLTKNADTSVLNLSKKVEDGMVIVVYSKTEIKNYLDTITKEKVKQKICDNGNIVNDACIKEDDSNKSTTDKLVNINTATIDELMSLSGIGEAKAKNIITYRSKTPFQKKEDLLKVEGIGDNLYSTIKENITV